MVLKFVDIDETLFFTKATVNVVKNGEIVKRLRNQEYNTYVLNEGESFDYSEFKCSETFTSTSEPNLPMILKTIAMSKIHEVALLTARADFDDKDKVLNFLRSYGLDVGHYKDGKIHVIRSGNIPGPSAVRKREVIEGILAKRPDVTGFELYDDAESNLKAIKEMGGVAYKVDHSNITLY